MLHCAKQMGCSPCPAVCHFAAELAQLVLSIETQPAMACRWLEGQHHVYVYKGTKVMLLYDVPYIVQGRALERRIATI